MQKAQVLLAIGLRLLLANPALFFLAVVVVLGNQYPNDLLKEKPFNLYATIIIASFFIFAYLEGAVVSGFSVVLRSPRLTFNEILHGGKAYFRDFLILKVLQGIISFIIMLPFFMILMSLGTTGDGQKIETLALDETSMFMEWGPAIIIAIGSAVLWPINIVAPILIVLAKQRPMDAITNSYIYIGKNVSELLPLLSVLVLVPSVLMMIYAGNPLQDGSSLAMPLIFTVSTLISLPTMIVYISEKSKGLGLVRPPLA
jgi:hypothetical protein